VFTPVSRVTVAFAVLTGALAPLLRSSWLQDGLIKRIEKAAKGPDFETREATPSFVWGEAKDAQGRAEVIRIKTLNGYSLTVFSALAIAQHVMTQACLPGCWTPAALMGEDFILSLPGTSLISSPAR
jgi:short subunit dehydrogenase-like uncharacterized protein